MNNQQNYTKTITVDQSPEDVFAAVINPRGWWSETIVGDTEKLGDEFVFEVPGAHYSKMKLTEVVPHGRVVWHVVDATVEFVQDKDEWTGTDVVFDISEQGGTTQLQFTHVGLVPDYECYNLCSDAWGSYIAGSLYSLITTGAGMPNRKEDTFESEKEKSQQHKESAA